MKSIIIAAALGAAVATAAYAQTTEFYIVQDVKTKKCTVVEKKPAATETTMTIVGDTVYKTRTEAEGAIKTVKVCTDK